MYALQFLIDRLPLVLGVQIEYLPPYSPDLNLIEEAFLKIKAFIHYVALDVITSEDAIGYFIHAGYF